MRTVRSTVVLNEASYKQTNNQVTVSRQVKLRLLNQSILDLDVVKLYIIYTGLSLGIHKHVKISVGKGILFTTHPHKHVKNFGRCFLVIFNDSNIEGCLLIL